MMLHYIILYYITLHYITFIVYYSTPRSLFAALGRRLEAVAPDIGGRDVCMCIRVCVCTRVCVCMYVCISLSLYIYIYNDNDNDNNNTCVCIYDTRVVTAVTGGSRWQSETEREQGAEDRGSLNMGF